MKSRNKMVCIWSALAMSSAVQVALADAKPNPYQPIIERNTFALRPPPPPPDNTPPPPPAPPSAKVILTGITSMFGPSSKRALVEITEQEPGKPPSTKKPVLREGESLGSVEVLEIDVERNIVKIRNSGVETNLTFEVAKANPTPAAPVPYPGAPGVPGFNPVPAPPHANAPLIISPGAPRGAQENSGVSVFSPASTGVPAPIATASAVPANYAGGGIPAPGFTPTIPSRTTRAQATTPQTSIDPAVQYLNMHLQAEDAAQKGRVSPPVPPMPGGRKFPGQ